MEKTVALEVSVIMVIKAAAMVVLEVMVVKVKVVDGAGISADNGAGRSRSGVSHGGGGSGGVVVGGGSRDGDNDIESVDGRGVWSVSTAIDLEGGVVVKVMMRVPIVMLARLVVG